MAWTVGVSRNPASRGAVQASADPLKPLREKRWDTIEIWAFPYLVGLSGTCYRKLAQWFISIFNVSERITSSAR